MPNEKLVVEVNEKGALVVRKNIESIGAGAKKAESSVNLLTKGLAFIGGAAVIKQLIGVADQFTNIQNRLKTVTNGQAELTAVTDELFRISRGTRSSFQSTAEVYSRVGSAAKDLGVSQRELLDFTESLNQAVLLSGASSTEASAALVQLSQGLASGALRGEELNSVLEQTPIVADVIAKELGVTRGQLRALGADGKITAEIVLEAFKNARGDLARDVGELDATFGQSLQVLRDSFIKVIGDFDKSKGITSALANNVLLIADNLDKLAGVADFVGDVLSAVFSELGGLFGALFEETSKAPSIIGDVFDKTLRDVGLFLVSLLRTAAQIVDKTIGLFTGLGGAVIFNFQKIPGAIADVTIDSVNFVGEKVESIINLAIRGANKLRGVVGRDLLDEVSLTVDNRFEGDAKTLGISVKDAFLEGFNQTAVTDVIDGVITRVQDAQAARDAAAARGGPDVDLTAGGGGSSDGTSENVASRTLMQRFETIRMGLEQEAQLLGLTSRERDIQNQLIGIESELRKELEGVDESLIQTQLKEAEALLRNNQALSDQAAIVESIIGPQREFEAQLDALNQAFIDGQINAEQYNEAFSSMTRDVEKEASVFEQIGASISESLFGAALDTLTDFSSTWDDFAERFLADLGRIAAQQALLNAFKAFGLPGFQDGGSFTVGGQGGPDSQLVAFKASPGERVDISPPGESRGGSGGGGGASVIVVNVTDPNEIGEYISSNDGAQVILNVLSKNRQATRAAIS